MIKVIQDKAMYDPMHYVHKLAAIRQRLESLMLDLEDCEKLLAMHLEEGEGEPS